MRDRFASSLLRLASIGNRPTDSPQERLRKQTLAITSLTIMVLATAWWVIYLAIGRPSSALFPLLYQLGSLASIWWFWRTGRDDLLRLSQVGLMLLLPVLLQWSLGGFVQGSAVIFWSLAAPMGALVFAGARWASGAFGLFLGLVAISVLIDPWLAAQTEPLPAPIQQAMFGLNILGPSFVSWMVLLYFVRQRNLASDALTRAHHELQLEQQRSEQLLCNVLPSSIAARLKAGEEAIADGYDDVTVLFADIVDFTSLTRRLEPHEVVQLLNRIVSRLDLLAERHGLEKIKTAGDSYMAVAGAPLPRPDHAEAAALMALELRPAVSEALAGTGHAVRLRIGLHSGPVVAGVIGRHKFAYDVWGDAVNLASRMESQGVADEIQVSDKTRRHLGDRFVLRPRATIEVKGMGAMETWFLVGPRSDAASSGA